MSVPYSQLRQAPRVNLVASVPLPGPMTVYLEVTNICNFKCVFCPESFDNYEEKAGGLFRGDSDRVLSVLDQLSATGGIRTLNFYMMGEPFVHKQLPLFIRHAKAVHAADRLSVTSNGTLLLPRVFDEIIDSGLDYLRISIYGGTEASHQERTQSSVPLARIRENVAGFRQRRDARRSSLPHIYVKMIDSRDPVENESFRLMFADIADDVKIEPVMNWNDPREGNLAGVVQDELLQSDYFANRKQACPFPFYTIVIHSDLKVSVCCVDWDKQLLIGDLATELLADIWRGPKLRQIQIAHLEGRRSSLPGCATCTYLHTAPDSVDALSADEFKKRCSATE